MSAQHPEALLTPTIVVALDDEGAKVCERLASLLRANVRGPNPANTRAIRDRFGFLRVRTDPSAPPGTDVQAITIDPSERLWKVCDSSWQYRPFVDQREASFEVALRQAISGVLHYTLDEDDLKDQHIIVQPSVLNIFLVGALLDETASAHTPHMSLSDCVKQRLEVIGGQAEQIRQYAEESASLELIVRGAFLSLVMPLDSYLLIRDGVSANGTAIGNLLTPPVGAAYPDAVGYREPALHFCALYTDHDDRGAWYDAQQVANCMASSIYALMQSELMDNGTCATQLGLRDPYAGPYERLVTIAAMRATLPHADLLDYAALQYGAFVLDALLPPADGTIATTERNLLRPDVADALAIDDLSVLARRLVGSLWDRRGRPRQLSALATDADSPLPDLLAHIPEPRTTWRQPWRAHVGATLDRLTHLDRLSVFLIDGQPLADDDGQARKLQWPDLTAPANGAEGAQQASLAQPSFTYDDEPLLRAWQQWRWALDQRINQADQSEVKRRFAALCAVLNRQLWMPRASQEHSSTRGALVMLDLAGELLHDVQSLLRQRVLPALPDPASLDNELLRARERAVVRVALGPLVAFAVLFLPLLLYLLLAIGASPIDDPLTRWLRQPPLVVAIRGIDTPALLPPALPLAAVLTLGLFTIGMAIRIVQTMLALRAMRRYARLVRSKYALLLYQEEQQALESIAAQLLHYQERLEHWLCALLKARATAAGTLRERAAAISDRGFRDVTEYVPAARGGAQQIYDRQIQPHMETLAQDDLPRLRRDAQELLAVTDEQIQTDQAKLADQAQVRICALVLGDPHVTEQHPQARLRYHAYRSLQAHLEAVVRHVPAAATSEHAQELQQRTHLMVRPGARVGTAAHQAAYLIAGVRRADERPDLTQTILVRGLAPDGTMYVRIASSIWPRLFEGGGVKLK